MAPLIRNLRRALLDRDPSFCDMYEDTHARQAAAEYLDHIRRHIRGCFGERPLAILDAGCQAGRLLIPLAKDGHCMTGIDTSGFALRRAARHAKAHRLPVRLHRGNLTNLRRWVRPESLDVVVCTEVLYLCRNHREILQGLSASVKPGGLLCISHRPTLYYVAAALGRGQADQAASLVRRTEGPSPDGTYHNWQTPEQLRELYRGLHLNPLDCHPLDIAETQLDLSRVTDEEVKGLLESSRETDSRFRIPAYLLMIAHKTQAKG